MLLQDPAFVNSVYEQLALSSSSYAYCWSKWNGVEECPEDAVVIGAVEWCRDNQPSEVAPVLLYLKCNNRNACEVSNQAICLDVNQIHFVADERTPKLFGTRFDWILGDTLPGR